MGEFPGGLVVKDSVLSLLSNSVPGLGTSTCRGHSMQKFPDQGSNPHHSSDLSHSSDNARSLITKPPGTPAISFFFFLLFMAYTTATATPDPSRVCKLSHSSRQHHFLNPLSEARDPTHILMDTSGVHSPLSHSRNTPLFLFPSSCFALPCKAQPLPGLGGGFRRGSQCGPVPGQCAIGKGGMLGEGGRLNGGGRGTLGVLYVLGSYHNTSFCLFLGLHLGIRKFLG